MMFGTGERRIVRGSFIIINEEEYKCPVKEDMLWWDPEVEPVSFIVQL